MFPGLPALSAATGSLKQRERKKKRIKLRRKENDCYCNLSILLSSMSNKIMRPISLQTLVFKRNKDS